MPNEFVDPPWLLTLETLGAGPPQRFPQSRELAMSGVLSIVAATAQIRAQAMSGVISIAAGRVSFGSYAASMHQAPGSAFCGEASAMSFSRVSGAFAFGCVHGRG